MAARGKKTHYKRTKVRIKADYDQNYVRQGAKRMNCQPTFLYPAKISFKLKEKERKENLSMTLLLLISLPTFKCLWK